MDKEFRVGNGFDVHKLKEKLPLVLGGVKIPYKYGLEGHSDADVIVHSVIDALLGAVGKGDIGEIFPDNNEKYRGISSLLLLKEIFERFIKDRFAIVNIDVTVICEKPKLAEYKKAMKKNITQILNINEDRINIKATTTEKLGFTGRGEGIASYAICSVKEI